METLDKLLTQLLGTSPTGAAIFLIAMLALSVVWCALRLAHTAMRNRDGKP